MRIVKKIFKWVGIFLGALILIFTILLIIPEKETVKTIQPRETTQYWKMKEGFKIAFTHLHGIDSIHKSPILFLHGGPGGYVHSSIIEALGSLTKKGYDVYLYDQRGSGLSDRMEKYSDINFEKHILDLHEIITKQINTDKVILIGPVSYTHLRAPRDRQKSRMPSSA